MKLSLSVPNKHLYVLVKVTLDTLDMHHRVTLDLMQ